MPTLSNDVIVAGMTFSIEAEIADCRSPVMTTFSSPLDTGGGAQLLRIWIEAPDDQSFTLVKLQIRFSVPAIDMHGVYLGGDPGLELGYLPHAPMVRETAAHRGVPYLAFVHRDGGNRRAVGLLDQLVETTWHAQLSELSCAYDITISKPAATVTPDHDHGLSVSSSLEEVVFVSESLEPWAEVLGDYATAARAQLAIDPLPVPDHAFDPVFCTWTAVHHDVSHEWAVATAKVAAELGFRTWITDDGWYHDRGEFGRYDDVGSWRPSPTKFPDFVEHVRAVKELGFRYMLWVAPFMVGTDSDAVANRSDVLLPGDQTAHFNLLDPLRPETGEHVSALLSRLVEDFELDGLKIDFIDAVPVGGAISAREDSTGRAMFRILNESIRPLAEQRPGLLIEFRNSYANLASRAYANMYRSSDLPVNFFQNRWQTTMLRILAPDAAVVTDPMLWHRDDSDENVAVHVINGIAAVPMVSVDLVSYPASHRRVIAYWMSFYSEHRDTLAHGDFRPMCRGTHLPRIDFVGLHEIIHGLYDDVSIEIEPGPFTRWILNASTRPYVELAGDLTRGGVVTTRNLFGDVTSTLEHHELPPTLAVAVGGSVEIAVVDDTDPAQAGRS